MDLASHAEVFVRSNNTVDNIGNDEILKFLTTIVCG